MSDDDCGRHIPTESELLATAERQSQFPTEVQDEYFPYEIACRAIATCRRVAGLLDTDLKERVDMVDSLHEWTGGHRDDFDGEWSSIQSSLVAVKEGLELLTGGVETVWDEVDAINAGRHQTRTSEHYDPRDYDPNHGR